MAKEKIRLDRPTLFPKNPTYPDAVQVPRSDAMGKMEDRQGETNPGLGVNAND